MDTVEADHRDQLICQGHQEAHDRAGSRRKKTQTVVLCPSHHFPSPGLTFKAVALALSQHGKVNGWYLLPRV